MDGGVEGDGWLYDGSVRIRLEFSSPSLRSSASHLRFLVRLAGGDIGGGVSAGAGALVAAAGTGGVPAAGSTPAVVTAEGQRGRRLRRLRLLAAIVCIGNWQCRVTSWNPGWWLTEIRAAWPEETQMSYNDMKSEIAGELLKEPARVAAHVGATLRVSLAEWVPDGEVTPAGREPSTL